MNKVERFRKDLEAERNKAPAPQMTMPIDPLAQAHASIKMDGRTGVARTLVTNIVPDPLQPRKVKDIDQAEIGQLAASLKADKQIQPIVVEWKPELSKWMIVVGERRYRATVAAGLETIACKFLFEPLTPGQRLKMQLGENLHRKDFSDLERAEGFKRLMELNGWTQKQLADEMHLHPGTVSRALGELRGAIHNSSTNSEDQKTSTPFDPAELRGAIHNSDDGQGEMRSSTDELKASTPLIKMPKKKKRGPKPGKVITFKTTACTLTLAFKQRPTDDEIGQALREALDQHEQRKAAA